MLLRPPVLCDVHYKPAREICKFSLLKGLKDIFPEGMLNMIKSIAQWDFHIAGESGRNCLFLGSTILIPDGHLLESLVVSEKRVCKLKKLEVLHCCLMQLIHSSTAKQEFQNIETSAKLRAGGVL